MIKKLYSLFFIFITPFYLLGQATIDTAVNFNVKTIDGTTINLFHLLDEENKIVVIDFFSVTCGPCQQYAPDFQGSYEDFGENGSNVFHLGINWGASIDQVQNFDEMFGVTYPTVSGTEGGGNNVYTAYGILMYPTVIIIRPEDHLIVRKKIYPPERDSINNALIKVGGIMVGNKELSVKDQDLKIKLYPNPASSYSYLELTNSKDETVEISVLSLTGKTVFRKPYRLTEGNNRIKLNTKDWSNGLYFVKIHSNIHTYVQKLIINN